MLRRVWGSRVDYGHGGIQSLQQKAQIQTQFVDSMSDPTPEWQSRYQDKSLDRPSRLFPTLKKTSVTFLRVICEVSKVTTCGSAARPTTCLSAQPDVLKRVLVPVTDRSDTKEVIFKGSRPMAKVRKSLSKQSNAQAHCRS